MEPKKTLFNVLPLLLFVFSIIFFAFGFGYLTATQRWFPYYHIESGRRYADQLLHKRSELPWYYQPTNQTQKVSICQPENMAPGLTIFSCINDKKTSSIKVIEPDGKIVHEWEIDWFKVWPNATHIPEQLVPQSRPGTHIHGFVMLDNGDLVFNFTEIGLVRMDMTGKVIWRLPYCTHHSVNLDSDGYIWVCGKRHYQDQPLKEYPYLRPPVEVPTILQVSPDGDIVREILVPDVMRKNNLEGLLLMSSVARWDVYATKNFINMNEIEVFPRSMQEGVFHHGDILISLRNIHTVMIIDPETLMVRYIKTGGVIRHHDPDFIDGNTLSIFDNNNVENESGPKFSKIVLLDALTGTITEHYRGTPEHPFFTAIMGAHQWLPNGNVLITEAVSGRIFEIDPDGNTVWEYHNILGDGYTGIIEIAYRLQPKFNEAFFNNYETTVDGH